MNYEAPHTRMAMIRDAQHFTASICNYAHLSHGQLQRRPALEDDDSTLLEAWPLRRRQRQPDRRRGALGRSCRNMNTGFVTWAYDVQEPCAWSNCGRLC